MENKNYKTSYNKAPYNLGQHINYIINQEGEIHDYNHVQFIIVMNNLKKEFIF